MAHLKNAKQSNQKAIEPPKNVYLSHQESFWQLKDKPFYISSFHWFLWILLVYLPLSHNIKKHSIQITIYATRLIQVCAISLAIIVTWFMINTARAQADLINFTAKQSQESFPYIALNNLYFKEETELLIMRLMLHSNIAKNSPKNVQIAENWIKNHISINPRIMLYEDLIVASKFLRPKSKGCDVIKKAMKVHAYNKKLQKEVITCNESRKKSMGQILS